MTEDHFNTPEVWKAIPDFLGYEVSDQGRMRSFWKRVSLGYGRGSTTVLDVMPQKFLKPIIHKDGYVYLNLSKDKNKITCKITRLVLLAFVGPCPKGMESCHNDGNPANNCVSNLRWDTPKNNQNDRHKHGTNLCGEQISQAKLTKDEVIEIRRLYALGHPRPVIALNFQISSGHVWSIVTRKQWKHI